MFVFSRKDPPCSLPLGSVPHTIVSPILLPKNNLKVQCSYLYLRQVWHLILQENLSVSSTEYVPYISEEMTRKKRFDLVNIFIYNTGINVVKLFSVPSSFYQQLNWRFLQSLIIIIEDLEMNIFIIYICILGLFKYSKISPI